MRITGVHSSIVNVAPVFGIGGLSIFLMLLFSHCQSFVFCVGCQRRQNGLSTQAKRVERGNQVP
ncbi:hypothetical protein SCA6_002816 [Theobroma cacao]